MQPRLIDITISTSHRTELSLYSFDNGDREEIALSAIRDGQRVAIFSIAQQELAFVVGAPQLVRLLP